MIRRLHSFGISFLGTSKLPYDNVEASGTSDPPSVRSYCPRPPPSFAVAWPCLGVLSLTYAALHFLPVMPSTSSASLFGFILSWVWVLVDR